MGVDRTVVSGEVCDSNGHAKRYVRIVGSPCAAGFVLASGSPEGKPKDERAESVSVGVLVFDRSEAARAGLVGLLRRRALDVVAAVASEDQAAEAIARKDPDLVLVDLHHSDADGPAICAALRDATQAPLVILVSFMTDERWAQLRAAGADEYLLKRVDSGALERDLVSFAEAYRGRASSNDKKRDGRDGHGIR